MIFTHKIISDPKFGLSQETYYPVDFMSLNAPFQETLFHLDNDHAKGYIKEIFFEGILIKEFNLDLASPLELAYSSNMEAIEVHFLLAGDLFQYEQDQAHEMHYTDCSQSIIYRNGTQGTVHINSARLHSLSIYLSPSYFLKYLPTEFSRFDSFAATIASEDFSVMGGHVYGISNQTLSITNDIIHCNFKGHFKKMFLKSKIIELLLTQFEQQLNFETKQYSLKSYHIEKMYQIKNYILENLYDDFTLQGIARQFGTNINILKTGFREAFDTTVFGFIRDEKMKVARKLIENQDMSITAIAYEMGYNKPQHFSEAFKRKYGILPSKIRNDNKISHARELITNL